MTNTALASQAAIDAFIDALWLEEGLSKNTLTAYRRDLALLSGWLAEQSCTLNTTREQDLQAYFAVRHADTKATGTFVGLCARGRCRRTPH